MVGTLVWAYRSNSTPLSGIAVDIMPAILDKLSALKIAHRLP